LTALQFKIQSFIVS